MDARSRRSAERSAALACTVQPGRRCERVREIHARAQGDPLREGQPRLRAPEPGHELPRASARSRVRPAAGDPGVRPFKAATGALESGPGGRPYAAQSSRAPTDMTQRQGAPGRRSRSSTPTTTRTSKATSPRSTLEYGIPRAPRRTGASRRSPRPEAPPAAGAGHERMVGRDLARRGDRALGLPQCKVLLVEAKSDELQKSRSRGARGGHARSDRGLQLLRRPRGRSWS